jgi:PilZ domain
MSRVSTAPSVLILDDGELDRLQLVLERIGADFERLTGDAVPEALDAPRDLLITSGRRAMRMPQLHGPAPGNADPFWICIYDVDFRPLRERLRALGVHFLIHGDVDAESVRLFLLQLLHRGEERRRCRRIPMHCEIELEVGIDRRKVELVEISGETCRFVTDRDIPGGAPATLRLPTTLTAGEPCELRARRIRAAPFEVDGGASALAIVVGFSDLAPQAREPLRKLLAGAQSGTQVTPLAEEPGAAVPSAASSGPAPQSDVAWDPERDVERRSHPRHAYDRRVEALHWSCDAGPRVALGKDLSLSGVRVVTSSRPAVGAHVTLALYGAPREEPVVVEAEVVRVNGAESSLCFREVGARERRQLEKLQGGPLQVESLQAESAEPVVIAHMLGAEEPARH